MTRVEGQVARQEAPRTDFARRLLTVALTLLTLAPLAVLGGCTVRFISEYDAILDGRVADIAEETESFIDKATALAGTPEGVYAEHAAFYRDSKAAVRALKLRAEATPKAELVAEQLELLHASFEDLRKVHEVGGDKGLRALMAKVAIDTLRIQFRSIHKLQAELRRGERGET